MLTHLYEIVRQRAERYPDAVAVGGQQALVWKALTSRQLLELVDRLADELADEGVREGDRVVVWLPSGWRTPVYFFALWKLGAVVVPFDQVEHVVAGLAGQGDDLAGRLAGGLGEPGLDRLERLVEALVEVAHALFDELHPVVERLAGLAVRTGQRALELLALHLDPLQAEDPETHGRIYGVFDQSGDVVDRDAPHVLPSLPRRWGRTDGTRG